jgi:hypothetical protein
MFPYFLHLLYFLPAHSTCYGYEPQPTIILENMINTHKKEKRGGKKKGEK